MTATKKSIRFLTVLALIFAMVLSIASVPVSAAGVETWYANTNGYRTVEDPFVIRGYNLTPVKTMGVSGTLDIDFTALEFLDSSQNPVNFKCEVRSTSGAVLDQRSYTITNNIMPFSCGMRLNVTAGQKIQVYISAYDAVTGNYKTAKVQYSRYLEAY